MKILASTLLATSLAIPAAAEAGSLRVGASLVLSPDGGHTDDAPGYDTVTHDLGVAYGVSGLLGYDVLPWLSVGLVPSVLLDVGFGNGDEGWDRSFTEIDLAARVTGRLPLSPGGVEAQLHVSPGYSWMIESYDHFTTPKGRSLGVGVGIAVPLSAHLSLVGELGMVFGSHRTNARGFFGPNEPESVRNIEYSFDTARIGLGVQATL